MPLLPLAYGVSPPVGLSEHLSRCQEDVKFLEQLIDNSRIDDYKLSTKLKVTLRRCGAVEFHPLVACEENASQTEPKRIFQSFHGIFLNYGVDAYISGPTHSNDVEERPIIKSKTGTARYKGLAMTKINQNFPYLISCLPDDLKFMETPPSHPRTMLMEPVQLIGLVVYMQQVEKVKKKKILWSIDRGYYDKGKDKWFNCGQPRHMIRNYPAVKLSLGQTRFLLPFLSSGTKGCTIYSGTSQNHLYALTTRQEFEALPNIVTEMLILFSYDVYYLLDPGSTLSYVTPFVAMHFRFGPECIPYLFSISTSVGDSVVARRVYRYHQLNIGEANIPKTTSHTRYGHFEIPVMSFGIHGFDE
ncbi:hypothetical protein FXO37_30970 [Capsicum annuum]|nr:hypothetical protein FXO37_30970 [Capsicum annuum]